MPGCFQGRDVSKRPIRWPPGLGRKAGRALPPLRWLADYRTTSCFLFLFLSLSLSLFLSLAFSCFLSVFLFLFLSLSVSHFFFFSSQFSCGFTFLWLLFDIVSPFVLLYRIRGTFNIWIYTYIYICVHYIYIYIHIYVYMCVYTPSMNT